MRQITVRTETTSDGFVTYVDKKKYRTCYPPKVWQHVPLYFRLLIAQNCSYVTTHHLTFKDTNRITYAFAPSLVRSLFMHGLFYSMAATPLEFPKKKINSTQLLKQAYNSDFAVSFTRQAPPAEPQQPPGVLPQTALVPFSFGKDSLLTHALCTELGISVLPVFFEEPTSVIKNAQKHLLNEQFEQKYHVKTLFFNHSLGTLKRTRGLEWGWDMILTEYSLFLMPYLYQQKTAYLLWSDSRDVNITARTLEGYTVNPYYEQNAQWTLQLTSLMRSFNLNTTVSNLLEPMFELLIFSTLHYRYPEIAQFQISCDSEKKASKKWCGNCSECAHAFIFFKALGLPPERVGLTTNMFALSKKRHFGLFSQNDQTKNFDCLFQSYPERLLAFYLAYRRNEQGPLIEEFKKTLLPRVVKIKNKLFDRYTQLYPPLTIPPELAKKVMPLYRQELGRLRRNIIAYK